MPRFAIRNPYFIVVVALIATVVGTLSTFRMPVDLFPAINIPVVVVATFYNGMPPEEIETDITGSIRTVLHAGRPASTTSNRARCPGSASSRSTSSPVRTPDSDVNDDLESRDWRISRRLPPGTLPPIVQSFDASSLPVCLVTLKGEGITETALRDFGQFQIRNAARRRAGRLGAHPRLAASTARSWSTSTPTSCRLPPQSDGRGARGEQREPHPPGRRREDRSVRLQPLHEQPVSAASSDINAAAAQDGRPGDGDGRRRRVTPRTRTRFRRTSSASTASRPSTCRS